MKREDLEDGRVMLVETTSQNKPKVQYYRLINYEFDTEARGKSNKRISKTKVTITLGFEIDKDGYPVVRSRTLLDKQSNNFSFLPISKDQGFNFLIHSDFELLANREGIPEKEFNTAIRDKIPEAFTFAVEKLFKTDDVLRVHYFKYLQCPPT